MLLTRRRDSIAQPAGMTVVQNALWGKAAVLRVFGGSKSERKITRSCSHHLPLTRNASW